MAEKNLKTNEDLLNDIYRDMQGQVQQDVSGVEESPAEDVVEDGNVTDVEDDVTMESEEVVEDQKDDPAVEKEDDQEDDTFSFDDWDDEDQPEASSETVSEPDYSDLAKELGVQDASKEAIINKIKEIKESREVEDTSDLPSVLQEAIALAKKGEDFNSLFQRPDGYIDHSLYDDEQLLMQQYSDVFREADGSVDVESLKDYLQNELTDTQKRVEARRLRNAIEKNNQFLEQQRSTAIRQQREQADKSLRDTLSGLEEIRGFKLRPSDKKEIYEKISSGQAAKEMFYKEDGTQDMRKSAELYFLYKNFDKIKNFLVTRAKNSARKEDFEKISNSTRGTSRSTNAAPDEGQKKKSSMDLWLEELQERAKQNI